MRVETKESQIPISRKMRITSHKNMQDIQISRIETEKTWTSQMKLILH
jgi:hypothetical protein